MDTDEMRALFEAHREAEKRRDFAAILDTFADDCYLETVPLGLRSAGKESTRASYEAFFTAFPDLEPDVGTCDVKTTYGGWSGSALSSAPLAIAFLRVSVRMSPGRLPCSEPLYSNQISVPPAVRATRSISTPSSGMATHRSANANPVFSSSRSHCAAN